MATGAINPFLGLFSIRQFVIPEFSREIMNDIIAVPVMLTHAALDGVVCEGSSSKTSRSPAYANEKLCILRWGAVLCNWSLKGLCYKEKMIMVPADLKDLPGE